MVGWKAVGPVVRFADVPQDGKIRLWNCYGRKMAAVQSEEAREFYDSNGAEFHGWNFEYRFLKSGPVGFMSIAPDTEVELLPSEPPAHERRFVAVFAEGFCQAMNVTEVSNLIGRRDSIEVGAQILFNFAGKLYPVSEGRISWSGDLEADQPMSGTSQLTVLGQIVGYAHHTDH